MTDDVDICRANYHRHRARDSKKNSVFSSDFRGFASRSSRSSRFQTLSITCQSEDMGFFSSRQAEDNDVYQVTLGVGGGRHGGNDKSVVQVIRSRFVRSLLLVQCPVVTHARKKTLPSLLTCPSSYTGSSSFRTVLLVRQEEQRTRRSTTANYFISGWRIGSAGPIP